MATQADILKTIQEIVEFTKNYTANFGLPVDLPNDRYEQLKEIERKNVESEHTRFSMFINLMNFTPESSKGFFKVLKWDDSSIDTITYFSLIHPDYFRSYGLWAIAAYRLASDLRDVIAPLKQTYTIRVPLKYGEKRVLESGEIVDRYFWCEQSATAVRLDEQRNLIVHMNVYHRLEELNEYNTNLMNAYLCNENEPAEEWTKRLREKMSPGVKSFFSPKEIETLQKYKEGYTLKDLAQKEAIAEDTIRERNTKIIEKSRILIGKELDTARDVADFLYNQGFLNHTPLSF